MSTEHPPYITTMLGGVGYFAVLLCWNNDYGGFYEPYTTGIGRYAAEVWAEAEAREWAVSEGIEFRKAPPKQHDAHVLTWRLWMLRAERGMLIKPLQIVKENDHDQV